MNFVMIDTSVWIDYLRNKKSTMKNEMDQLLDQDRVCTCGIVELELLQGIRTNKEKSLIKNLFSALHYIDMERADFGYAGTHLQELRKKGITIPSSDCIIATLCLSKQLTLYTLDKHFTHIPNLLLHTNLL